MGKQTLGRWVLGLGGALGLSKEILTEPPAKNIVAIESTEHPTTELTPRQDSNSKEASRNETPIEKQPVPPTEIEQVQKTFEEIQNPLPPLKHIIEQTPVKNFDFKLNPFLGLENAKAFVTHTLENVTKKCVDKITHLMPDLLPTGTVGITVTDVSTPQEQVFRIRIDQVVANEEKEKSWQQFYDAVVHPATESVEFLSEPELEDIFPPHTITGDPAHIQEEMQMYQESIALARVYLQAGVPRQEVRTLAEEKTKKKEKKK
ncbi:MAG: hypothetical protein NTX72_04530 [Candidatus Uhrbacteria bacterium]|nr:hypothetical protein [Candidatus Uhrbacteria bacterium]